MRVAELTSMNENFEKTKLTDMTPFNWMMSPWFAELRNMTGQAFNDAHGQMTEHNVSDAVMAQFPTLET